MTKIRTLIVDDEPMARERVLLAARSSSPTSRWWASAPTARRPSRPSSGSSRSWCSSTCRFPVMDGFGVLRALAPEPHADGGLHDRVRRVRAARLRGPRARLPAEAVRQPALPPHARARARAARAPARRRSGQAPAGDGAGPAARAGAAARSARREVRRPHLLRAHSTRSTGSTRPATTCGCT